MKHFLKILVVCSTLLSCQERAGNEAIQIEKNHCYKFTNGKSTCLEVYENIDSMKINQLIQNENKVLIVFTGWAQRELNFLNKNDLLNRQILDSLKQTKIVELYVDDKVKKDSSTIGGINLIYQMKKFNVSSQPYYVLVNKNSVLSTSGYISKKEDALKFLSNNIKQ